MRKRMTVAGLAVLMMLSLLSACERAKTKLDGEVDRLCAIDGGVHIYETVTLPKENFGPNGEVFPQYRWKRLDSGRYGSEYTYDSADAVVVSGDPALQRINSRILRKKDGRLLGEVVIYRRSGGDFPGPWEPSTYSCPKGRGADLESQLFRPQGE